MLPSTLLAALSAASSVSASALRYRAAAPDPTQAVGVAAVLAKRAEATAAWVSVDDEGQPESTYTPSATVVDGTTSYVHGAPHDLTASVYTYTSLAKLTTSTGEPPNPTATAKSGQGAFARCHNLKGAKAPLCDPAVDSRLIVGNTYYVTWDPDYFDDSKLTKSNSTWEVSIRLDYLNETSLELVKQNDPPKTNASWGFYPIYLPSKYLHGYDEHNFTITLQSHHAGHTDTNNVTAIWVQLAKDKYEPNPKTSAPTGQTLTIALPVVFGAIVLLLVGGCLWNRQTRRIAIGNVMSRSRHGYSGRKARRAFRGKDTGIQLDTRGDEYRDVPEPPRRANDDDLGSLAGSPVDPSFHQQGTTGGRNAFREEMARQERERR